MALAQRPDLAVAPPQVVRLLERLTDRGYAVSVVTGRSQESLDMVLGRPRGCTLVFLHGWEILWNGVMVCPWGEPTPLPDPFLDALASIAVPGVILERKGVGVALHYRLVEPSRKREARQAFLDAFARHLQGVNSYTILEGKEVVEVRPRGASKGRAVAWVLERLAYSKPVCVAAFGDDATDVDMFLAIGAAGLTVAVGDRQLRGARWWVHAPDEVWQALEMLL